eukprot:3851512-Karenia_brevis.AAC.1
MELEYVPDRDLKHHVMHKGRLALKQVYLLLAHVQSALMHVHSCGVAHRDVKLENMFMSFCSTAGPVFKLGDFGLARKADA